MTLNIALVIITFLVMEGMAWLTHKFVMHGFMWYFHEDHHQPTPGFFEKNGSTSWKSTSSSLIFAKPASSMAFK